MNCLARPEPDWSAFAADASDRSLLVHFGVTDDVVARRTAGLVYLATPYSNIALDERGNWSVHGSAAAMERASRVAARLAKLGVSAYSPIVMAADMCHTNATLDPLDATFWTRWCAPLLDACRSVVIPAIDGWDQSVEIWHEVREAVGRNKPVYVYGGAE